MEKVKMRVLTWAQGVGPKRFLIVDSLIDFNVFPHQIFLLPQWGV